MDVLLGREGKPDWRLSDGRFLVGEQVLLAVLTRRGGRLLDVGDKCFAGLEGLLGVNMDRGIRDLCNRCGLGHGCEYRETS